MIGKLERERRKKFDKFILVRKKKKKSINLLYQAMNHLQIQPYNILLTLSFLTLPLKMLFLFIDYLPIVLRKGV